MSETILEGKLTIEIEPGLRDKQRVTARNCNSVLNVDVFNLADSSARAKFVKGLNLDGDEATETARTLIDLTDRFNRVNDAVSETEEKESLSKPFLRNEIRAGKLRVVRPGNSRRVVIMMTDFMSYLKGEEEGETK
jgi:hypothetical protein